MSDQASPSASPTVNRVVDEQLARAVFELALDGIVVLAADGGVMACNESFLALWNFPPDMLARLDPTEMRAYSAQQLKDPAQYLRSLEGLMRAEVPQTYDVLALKDGRVFERHVSPLRLEARAPGLVVRWRDITARHRAEQALAHSQARLSAVVENALNAILLASDDGRYVDVNPAACALTGYTREELLALSVSQLVVPGTADLDTAWAGFLEAGSARGRVQLQRKDGTHIVAEFNAKAQVLPGLNLSIMSDVTEDVRVHERLENLAQTDALTGIFNRRHFLALATVELARASRLGLPTAMLMIDLDHFKAINDTHGHAAGDEVLRTFAQAVAGEIRQGEYFARVGGEEFAVLLPQTERDGAAVFARRLLEKVREHPAQVGGKRLPFTASIGVAALGRGKGAITSVDQLMALADRALYRGKASGRDRVEVSDEAT